MKASGALLLILLVAPSHAETWMGLEMAPEDRCSPFNRDKHYPYSQSLNQRSWSAWEESSGAPHEEGL